MSKNDDILSQIGGIYILYKFRWVIFIGILFFAVIIFSVKEDLDKEYQQYGYTGFSDNTKYDEWTDEVIPKDEISTYNNDNKYIAKSTGEKVYFLDIKKQLNAYEELQENYMFIQLENVEQAKAICDVLFASYFELPYSIDKTSDENSYLIHLKDFTTSGMYYYDYSIGPAFEMEILLNIYLREFIRSKKG